MAAAVAELADFGAEDHVCVSCIAKVRCERVTRVRTRTPGARTVTVTPVRRTAVPQVGVHRRPVDRFEQDRLLGADCGGGEHGQRVARDIPRLGNIRSPGERRRGHEQPERARRDQLSEQFRPRQHRREQQPQLIHRLQRQPMRYIVAQSDLRVECTHDIRERASSGHDEHRPVAGKLERIRTPPAQSSEPLGAAGGRRRSSRPAGEAHSRPSTDSATAAATSPPVPFRGPASPWTRSPQRVAAARARNAPTPTATTGSAAGSRPPRRGAAPRRSRRPAPPRPRRRSTPDRRRPAARDRRTRRAPAGRGPRRPMRRGRLGTCTCTARG